MKRKLVVLAVVVIAGVTWWFQGRVVREPVAAAPPVVQMPAATAAMDDAPLPGPSDDAATVMPPAGVDRSGCLSMAQMDEHPDIRHERNRLSVLQVSGPDIEPFRHVPQADVLLQARAGNSAAMAVLATQYLLQAQGEDAAKAVDAMSSPMIGAPVPPMRNLSDEQRQLLTQAEHWFYEAALHGRVMALTQYGALRFWTVGGAVELGWKTRDEFDALSKIEQADLFPGNVYLRAAYDSQSEMHEGFIGVAINMVLEADRFPELRSQLLEELENERAARGLQRPIIEPSRLSFHSLKRDMCASDFEQMLNELPPEMREMLLDQQ